MCISLKPKLIREYILKSDVINVMDMKKAYNHLVPISYQIPWINLGYVIAKRKAFMSVRHLKIT